VLRRPGEDTTEARAEARRGPAAHESVKSKPALIHAEVDADAVARSSATGPASPSARCRRTTIGALLTLEDKLRGRVRGQDHAMSVVAETIRISQAGINNPNQPVGVLLFVGPVGRRQDRDGDSRSPTCCTAASAS
jgi:type VI secretion system protein VasG